MFSWRQKVPFWVERAVLCVAVLYFLGHSMPRAWRTLNTDFPNYYMAARLVHEGYDTSRVYEWTWMQRQKDHLGVDRRVVGLLPITPFSTLAVWPIATLKPLTAKHVWIGFNLLLLIPLAWMLRRMTGLSYSRIVLVYALSFPLYRNLEYGQFYILLMTLIVAACWCWLRGWKAAAAALVVVAAGLKVFPLLLLVWFFRRRQWRALWAGAVTGAACVGLSIAAYGLAANRTWLKEILPWVTRGEGLGTFITGWASISEVLHGLLLNEPQWNLHPWHESLMAYSVLESLLPMIVLAPAILLIQRKDAAQERVLMEWSALTTAALAISTIPASYNFVLVVFPVCVLAGMLLKRKQYGWLAALAVAFLGIGYPLPIPAWVPGLAVLLWIPRLWLMLAMLAGIYVWLWRDERKSDEGDAAAIGRRDWEQYAWAAAMAASVIVSTVTTLHVERAQRTEYAYRLPMKQRAFSFGEPQATATGVRYTAYGFDGFRLGTQDGDAVVEDPPADPSGDDLSFANGDGHVWVEEAGSGGSRIVDVNGASRVVVNDAQEPAVSADGKELAFVRDVRGRGRLMVRALDGGEEKALTPPEMNVYEATFLSKDEYAFAAAEGAGWPHVYVVEHARGDAARGSSMQIVDARFPAISPDGRWLAYSHMEKGVWNLWLMDLSSGAERRIANVPCNEMQPSWESDSKTLLYGTDCGRSVWFTAVARRRVVP